jgi:predicted component of type VI protein secretion system
MTPFSELVLQNAILDVLRNFEPRISVVDIRVEADEENNGYNVTLYYIILNRNLPAAISMFLERIR